MRHRVLEMRLQDLEDKLLVLVEQIEEAKKGGAAKQVIGELMMKYSIVEARMDEVRLWQKMDEDNPKYGTQVRVDGSWRPKLPTFGSVEKALEVMKNPQEWYGTSTRAVVAARAYRAEGDAQETVNALDGRSPLLPESERKPFNTTL